MELKYIKFLLGIPADDTSKDTELNTCLDIAEFDIRRLAMLDDSEIVDEMLKSRIGAIIYEKVGSGALASQTYSNVSETYVQFLPEDVLKVLRSYYRLKSL